MVHFLFGETRDGLRSRVPKRGLLVQLGAPVVTRAVAECSFDLEEGGVSELTIFIDSAANETLVARATKEFRRTMTPMLLKEAGLAERMFSLKIYSIRPRTDGVEALCKLTDADARKLVVQQAGLNQLGVFIRLHTTNDVSQRGTPTWFFSFRMGWFGSQDRWSTWCAHSHTTRFTKSGRGAPSLTSCLNHATIIIPWCGRKGVLSPSRCPRV